jgi:hypothetical protein
MSKVMKVGHQRRIVTFGGAIVAATIAPLHAQTQKLCSPLEPRSSAEQYVVIKNPGCHVLAKPLRQGRWFVLSEGGWRAPGHPVLMETDGTDLDIDLGGLTLSSDAGIGGVSANAGKYIREFVPLSPSEPHRIRIRNGTIELSDSDGYSAPGVIAPNNLNSSEWRVHSLVQPAPLPANYRKVEYVLEDLTIKTQGEAAMLKGDGIVIRNCTIEARANNAIIVYGPNATIENNRIVYRHKDSVSGQGEKDWAPGHYARLRAAIYLRGADRAVIRNNTIDVSRWDRPVSAVAVVESKDVLIEGNRFSTDVTPVMLSGPSSAVLKRNEVEGGWFSKRRMLPDAALQNAK